MGWGEVLLILVSYCGAAGNTGNINKELADQCRHERVECVKKGVAAHPNEGNAAEMIDECLGRPNAYDSAKPAPIATPSPSPKVTFNPPMATPIPASGK